MIVPACVVTPFVEMATPMSITAAADEIESLRIDRKFRGRSGLFARLLGAPVRKSAAFWLPVPLIVVAGVAAGFWTCCDFRATATIERPTKSAERGGVAAESPWSDAAARELVLSESIIIKSARDAGLLASGSPGATMDKSARAAEIVNDVRNQARVSVSQADPSREMIHLELREHWPGRLTGLTAAIAQNVVNEARAVRRARGGAAWSEGRVKTTPATLHVEPGSLRLYAIATILAAVACGWLFAATAEIRDTAFHSVAEARQHLQVAVLGAVPITCARSVRADAS